MPQEAWLEGALDNVDKLLQPAAHALVQARRDIETACAPLALDEVWTKPNNNAASVGFHLLHVAGSIDRLLTYARGADLSNEQFRFLRAETEVNRSVNSTAELVNRATAAIETALHTIREIDSATLFELRGVGRQRLPTNVFGLLFHIAEHTQRHVGQIVTTAKIVGGQNEKG